MDLLFPFETKSVKEYSESVKWQIGNSRYEIHVPLLESIELKDLVPHCMSVRSKIESAVSVVNHRGPSFYRVFPRTLDMVLRAVWDQLMADSDADPNINNAPTPANFDDRLRDFIAAHTAETDRHELVQQLRSCRKPKNVQVQSFWYMLRRFNSYVDWLPGNEPALAPNQMKQAFYDAMPPTWRQRYDDAGNSIALQTDAEVRIYFRKQESRANRAQADNEAKQRRDAASKRRISSEQTNGKRGRFPFNGKRRHESNDDKPKDGASKKSRIDDDAPCPVHPGSTHSWKDCYLNAKNPNRKTKGNGSRAPGTENHCVTIDEEPEKINMTSTSDDDFINMDESEGMFHCECFVNEDLTLTHTSHHLDNMSFMNHEQTNDESNPFVFDESFMSLSEEIYSHGDSEIKLVGNTLDVTKSLRLRSVGIVTFRHVQGVKLDKPLVALLDSGSDTTMFNFKALPKGVAPKTVKGTATNSVHGTKKMNQMVALDGMRLPELSPTLSVSGKIAATMFNNPNSAYDVILGMDVLQALGIDIHNSTKTVSWRGNVMPFKPADYFRDRQLSSFYFESSDDPLDDPLEERMAQAAGYKSKVILHSKYDKVDPHEVARQQTHLSQDQRDDLARLFGKYEKLFSGKLGKYPHKKVHLELLPDTKPYSCRPYPVPRHHEQVFKDELQRLCDEGVLERCGPSEWLSPSFLIPKKDGRVRWISDFRMLNKCIKRKVYNLPKIQDILTRRSGYEFFSKIDVSMHYYTFELDDESKNLCTICTPFGNYRYNRLAMGVSQAPDVAQEVMETLFRHLPETDVYIDDVGCFSSSWQEHLTSLDKVLTILQENNFTVNPLKCEWGVKEADWLGYWLTPQGLKPWKKKVQAILELQRPQTAKQLRSFLGAVNFYRDMYPRRSHILAPLTKLTGLKGKVPWTAECAKAFQTMKALLAKEAFLQYPDHNKPFDIYADASDLQLGAAIFQDGKPVAFYSRKLNAAQKNYTVGEKELLSIVETLKEFRTMLYGCPNIHVHTDHKNNTFQKLQTQRVLRWRLFLEDYGVHFHYIKGESNSLADALSRLPREETLVNDMSSAPSDAFYSMAIDDPEMLDCFVHLPASSGTPFTLDYREILDAQSEDARLIALREKEPERFSTQLLAPNTELVVYTAQPNGTPWKIYLPTQMLDQAIEWYHLALGHVGQNRLVDTMQQHLYHPDLRQRVRTLVTTCDSCQRFKQVGRGHGHTAGREVSTHPWREVAVDSIGPWPLTVPGYGTISFRALSIIDTVTNLVELVRVSDASAAQAALQFENSWLSRYPRPLSCIYDQGGEFKGFEFQRTLRQHGIKAKPTTVKNPQANALVERMHQTVGNTLRTLAALNPPTGILEANQLVETALSICVFATRSTIHEALKTTPGASVFGRDMILDIPLVADWHTIQQHRQQLVDQRLIVANRKRYSYDYQVDDEVLKLVYKPDKLDPRAEGPYRVVQVHTNGTLTIQLDHHTRERISIRRLKPYHRRL